ncbi:hypothetical protein K443DRAFT_25812, partial [Laccaria amethystina LaAM-08-1]
MEIGSPMASLYLLGNPDHYTSHKFTLFYWKNYVREARSAWLDTENNMTDLFNAEYKDAPDKVVLQK